MAIESTATNSRACELCGVLPPDRFVRNQTARNWHARYVKTRSNRTLITSDWWRPDSFTGKDVYGAKLAAAGIHQADWAGKRVCRACYAKLIQAVN